MSFLLPALCNKSPTRAFRRVASIAPFLFSLTGAAAAGGIERYEPIEVETQINRKSVLTD